MKNIIDIDGGRRKSKARFVIHLTLVIVLTAGVIAGSLCLLFLSTLDYIPNLIINIVVDILLALFLVFYFLNIFPLVSYYHRLYKGMTSLSIEHRRKMRFVAENDNKSISNVNFRVLTFSHKEGETEYEEHLFVLDSDVQFDPSTSYKLDTYQNIIIRYQEIANATD